MIPRYFAFHTVSSLRYLFARRFTNGGLLVLTGLIVSAAIGVDTTRTMAYQVFTLLVAILIFAVAFAGLFRARVEIDRILPRFVSVGQPFRYRVVIRNQKNAPLAGATLFEDLVDPRPALREFIGAELPADVPRTLVDRALGYTRWRWLVAARQHATITATAIPTVPARGEIEVPIDAAALARGRLRWRGASIARPDPFNVFRAFVSVSCAQSVLVLPRRYPVPLVRLPGTRKYQYGGVALAGSVGDSEEFVSLRDYRPGDPRRRIHWKSFARVGKPIVKEYQEEFFVRHALVLDTFTRVATPAFEEAVSIAASFACSLETQESLLDLMFVGTEAFCFTSGRGLGTTDRMLEILAGVQVCRDRGFAHLHRLVIERSDMLSGCIAVLLAWDADRARFIDAIAALGIPTLVLVVTAAGARLDAAAPRDMSMRFHHVQVGKIAEGLLAL